MGKKLDGWRNWKKRTHYPQLVSARKRERDQQLHEFDEI